MSYFCIQPGIWIKSINSAWRDLSHWIFVIFVMSRLPPQGGTQSSKSNPVLCALSLWQVFVVSLAELDGESLASLLSGCSVTPAVPGALAGSWRRDLRGAASAALRALRGGLAAEPAPVQESRGVVKAQPLLVAPRYPAESLYPLTGFYTVICLDIEWLFSMKYLKHL